MRRAALALAVLALVACKKPEDEKKETKKSGPPSALVKDLESAAKKACACKDQTCADVVQDAVKKLAAGVTPDQIPESDLPALQAAQAEIDRCLAAVHPKIIEYVALADEVCACADKSCAEKVSKKFSTWADEVRTKKIAIPGGMGAILVPGTQAKKCLEKFGLDVPQ